ATRCRWASRSASSCPWNTAARSSGAWITDLARLRKGGVMPGADLERDAVAHTAHRRRGSGASFSGIMLQERFPPPSVRPPRGDGGPNWSARSSFCRILFPHIILVALELLRCQTVEIDSDPVPDLVGCRRLALLAGQVVPDLIVELAVEPII